MPSLAGPSPLLAFWTHVSSQPQRPGRRSSWARCIDDLSGPMAEDPGRPPALPPAPCLLLPSIWPGIWLRPKAGVGGGSGWLVVSHLPLCPMFNFRRITLPEVVVPPAGGPETRVRQGVLGDVGDHSLEGYSPFSLRGTAQNPCGPALSQALTISQPPPFGHTNHSIPPRQPTHRPGLSVLDQAAQRYPSLPRRLPRMVLPRQAPEM